MLATYHHIQLPNNSLYGILMLAAILLSAAYWIRVSKSDYRLPIIFMIALAGAFLGAKIAYLLAEGWLHNGPDRWIHWLTGKSITGALLGGYAGVEIGKKLLGYTRVTGDRFALIVPIGIIIGRLGCLSHGCCQGMECELPFGISHWPAVPAEIAFNLLAIGSLLWMREKNIQTHQHFHLYLIGYGTFRFLHEFLRATPKLFLHFSGYHIIALITVIVGVMAWRHRRIQTGLRS